MISKFKKLQMAVLTAGVLAGCDGKVPPTEVVAKFSQKFGIPVFLWAYPDDVCVEEQLNALHREYKGLKRKQRKALIERLRKTYDAIVIESSEDLGSVEGVVKDLQLVDRICTSREKYCTARVQTQKRVYDGRRTSRDKAIGTRVKRGESLEIRPSVAQDNSVRMVYQTTQPISFEDIVSGRYGDLETAALYREIVLAREVGSAGAVTCGRLASLRDLLP